MRTPLNPVWQVVRNYDQFVNHITFHGLENYEAISLDHDLGEDEAREKVANGISKRKARSEKKYTKSGYDCAKWLVEHSMNTKLYLPQIYVHSANPVGADNICSYINNYLYSCGLPQACIRTVVEHL